MNEQTLLSTKWARRRTYYTIDLLFRDRHISPYSVLTHLPPALHILLEHARDHVVDRVGAHIDVPPELPHRVEDDRLAEVAPRLERVARLGAERAKARARALRDRVGVVVHVRDGRGGERGGVGAGRDREVQALRGEPLAGRLECDGREAEGRAEEGGECTPEGVPDQPDGRRRIERSEVVDEMLELGG